MTSRDSLSTTIAAWLGAAARGVGLFVAGSDVVLVHRSRFNAAGSNTNRTYLTDNGVVSSSCYDHADRLVSTTDARFGAVAYDERGNTTTLGDQVLSYDAADRHIATTPASGAAIAYRRDPLDQPLGATAE